MVIKLNEGLGPREKKRIKSVLGPSCVEASADELSKIVGPRGLGKVVASFSNNHDECIEFYPGDRFMIDLSDSDDEERLSKYFIKLGYRPY